MNYIVSQTSIGRLLLQKDGKEVPATDILSLFPNRRVYAFHGVMGAGKTTFIKQLCEELGVTDVVNSPTFAVVNVYECLEGQEVYHFDCYRLKSVQEALDLGAEEYLYSGSYCFIEWPDIINDILPQDVVDVTINVKEDGSRVLTI